MSFMGLLEEYKNAHIIEKIISNIYLFNRFNSVYLFGSLLLNDRLKISDIDILLVYDLFSNDILDSEKLIRSKLNCLTGYEIDLIILSSFELEELHFLDKLYSKYLKIK